MNFKENEIIFLLGAGASKDADIPMSNEMIEKVENLILSDKFWKEFRDFYYLIKSAIFYADGVQGKFNKKVNFNIERLFNVLIELEKKEEHPLYPFIGQWNIKFSEIVGNDYELIKKFQDLILSELKNWITLKINSNADYYKKLKDFKIEINHSLRLFTLNYDLCVEKSLLSEDFIVERGFNENRIWDYKKIIDFPADNTPDIFLYKLHGSIDWERDKNTGEVKYTDCNAQNPDLIFGSAYKLQYVDPYLFQFSEFRHYTLKAKLIIVVGYGLGDEHINGIIKQALEQDDSKKLLYVSPSANKEEIQKYLGLNNDDQLETIKSSASNYFQKELELNKLKNFFPDDSDDLWM